MSWDLIWGGEALPQEWGRCADSGWYLSQERGKSQGARTQRGQAEKLWGRGVEERGMSGDAPGRGTLFPSAAAEVSPPELDAGPWSVPDLSTDGRDVWMPGCAPSLDTARLENSDF